MTVKDLQIDSPVYRADLDSIDVAHVRLIEAFNDGTRKIELTFQDHKCVEKTDASEIQTESRWSVYKTKWYLNIEDAELAQLVCRSEHVAELKKRMEKAQNEFSAAVQKYAFSEPSKLREL